MSNLDVDPSTSPPPSDGAGPPGQSPPDPSGGAGAPPGGGPVLAALSRQGAQPPVSAPGMGNMAQGLMRIKTAVDMLQSALPSLPVGGQQHRDVLRAVTTLARHLPQGAPTAGVQSTFLQDLLRMTQRNALMQKLRGGGGGAGPPGQGQQPPVPSTPLPGA